MSLSLNLRHNSGEATDMLRLQSWIGNRALLTPISALQSCLFFLGTVTCSKEDLIREDRILTVYLLSSCLDHDKH
jgi:hypothetical protein